MPSTATTPNPLLATWTGPFGLPPFDQIRPEHFAPALAEAMRLHLAELDAIGQQTEAPNFDNTVAAYDRAGAPYKIFAHVATWSEDTPNPGNAGTRVVLGTALVGVNLQSRNSHVIQFFTRNVFPFSAEETERFFDITRLKKQGR